MPSTGQNRPKDRSVYRPEKQTTDPFSSNCIPCEDKKALLKAIDAELESEVADILPAFTEAAFVAVV